MTWFHQKFPRQQLRCLHDCVRALTSLVPMMTIQCTWFDSLHRASQREQAAVSILQLDMLLSIWPGYAGTSK